MAATTIINSEVGMVAVVEITILELAHHPRRRIQIISISSNRIINIIKILIIITQ